MEHGNMCSLRRSRLLSGFISLLILGGLLGVAFADTPQPKPPVAVAECAVGGNVKRVVRANVIAMEFQFMYNRLGASQPGGLIFALASDVITNARDRSGNPVLVTASSTWTTAEAAIAKLKKKKPPIDGIYSGFADLTGKVTLRPDKRPRPMTLRANQHDCLEITLTNLIAPVGPRQPKARTASIILRDEIFHHAATAPSGRQSTS